jgi:diaminohydroxyphosphoribosylaminopyrimidine deaminase/5-amino-6-(5-phosphoribosylamino)uracil reductase
MDSNIHEQYMRRCLQLAEFGLGNVAPNPMVGAVVVHNGRIIGEGYHRKYGEAHAEVNAINAVEDKSLLKESTLYVSLEPCSHFGKTPPCCDLIIEHQIPRVVVAMVDPFEKVAGNGIRRLKENGVDVAVGVLEDEAKWLNRRFITFHTEKRPYVILKWAQTLDGFIDIEREEGDPVQPTWITNNACRTLVHRWRSEENGILVGNNTIIKDNPQLNVRLWTGNHPTRILIDRTLVSPSNSAIFDGTQPTIVFIGKNSGSSTRKELIEHIPNLDIVAIDFAKDAEIQIFEYVIQKNIQSIIVEGGSRTIQGFINLGVWDEARIFYGPKLFFKGVKAPSIIGIPFKEEEIDGTRLFYLKNDKQRG